MKPRFRLEVSGRDITDAIADRVLSIRVNDDAGQKSDTLDITLDDRDQKVDVPSRRSTIKVWMGWDSSELAYLGQYTIDEVSIQMNPGQVKIRGKATTSATYTTTKTRSWDNQTIGQIVSTIAGEHGLIPSVHANYSERLVNHIDQENESDAHFLTRMAKIYGAVSKPADGRLLFIPEGQGISTSGNTLASATVNSTELLTLRATVKDRGNYSSVITRYRDKETNQELEVTVEYAPGSFLGDGGVFRDKKLYTSRDMAEQAGQARLRQLASGNISLDFTVRGRPDIFAERPVTLRGVRAPLADEFIVKTVTHEFSGGGFTTKVSAGNKVS